MIGLFIIGLLIVLLFGIVIMVLYAQFLLSPCQSQDKYNKIMNRYTLNGSSFKLPYFIAFLIFPILLGLTPLIGGDSQIMHMHAGHDWSIQLYQTVANIGAPIVTCILNILIITLGLQLVLMLVFGHNMYKKYQKVAHQLVK